MNRNRFLKAVVKGTGLIIAGIVALPSLVTALTPVWRRPREQWQPIGRLQDFPVDGVQRAIVEVARDDWAESLRLKGVYVWRPSEEEVVVFSRNCTDLSCPVTWDPASGWFYCPCHGGIFAKDGERMAGPPKRALYRYANRIRNGVVEIDLRSLPPMT
jgi:menaquinol-cytochrome c reductase iron-sulfur subunit